MPLPSRARRGGARTAVIPGVLAALVAAHLLAAAQTPPAQRPNPFGLQPRQPGSTPPQVPAWAQPPGQQPPAQPPGQPPATPASPVIARIGGRPVTQLDFDRIAQPYYRSLRAQLGAGFTPEVQKLAGYNVVDELVRRELLAIEATRQNLQVTQEEIDALLVQDPFFLTDGKFDPAKFSAYKTNPTSNYQQVLPNLREVAAISKLDATLRKRFAPTAAQVRAEWTQRNDQVRFKVLPLLTRDMPLEPEASEAEWAEYYRSHPDQFMRKTRVRLRYVRLPIPVEGDSTRPVETPKALERARAIADSLRDGTLPDSAARLADTGLFDISAPSVPGLGRVAGLTDTLARLDEDSTLRVVGPFATRDAVIVGVIAERQPRHLPPMREVLGDVKRRADQEKRRTTLEADRRAFHAANRDRWRGPRLSFTRITLRTASIEVKPPAPEAVDAWYARRGRSLFGLPDTSRAWIPPISDSLRVVVRERMTDEERPRLAAETMARVAAALRTTRDAHALARTHGGAAETLTLTRHTPLDTLFHQMLLDSLLRSAATLKGTVHGPRALGAYWAAWRVDAADTAFVPTYDGVRVHSDQEFALDRRAKEEADARAYHEAHREDFKTPVKYALDYVAVRVPPPDSVRIPEAELRRRYDANRRDYRQEEQVKARHILFMTRDPGPDVERVAKARADSLLAAIRKEGGDFAELARRFSQEPGAPSSGGDLGWFARGRMVREFESAAFAMKPGEISDVVKTQFGYHIIKLEDRKPAGIRPFDEVRTELRRQLAQARGDSSARRAADALRRRLAAGGDVGALAAPHGGVVSAAPIAASDPLPGLGPAPGLAQDLPAMAIGRWARNLYRAGDRYLVIRPRETVAPRPAEFDEVRTQATEEMKNARRRALLDAKVEAIRAALAAGASLDSLAAPHGGLRDSGFQGRTAGFVPMVGSEPRVLERAFALEPGAVTDTMRVALGTLWMRVEERNSGDPAAYKTAAAQLEAEMARKRYDEWIEERKKSVRVEILRADLRRPPPSPFGTVTTSPGR